MRSLRFPALLIATAASVLGCQSQNSGAPSGAPSATPPAESAPADLLGPRASAVTPASAAPAASAEAPTREIAGAAHILVAYKGALGAAPSITRTKEAAKKRAEEALAKLKAEKATFEQLVKEYSDDAASKPAQGALGNFERNVMPQAFSDATFNLPVGGTSGVVETPRGFHIIRRTR